MREIKFRAWGKNKTIILGYGVYINESAKKFILTDTINPIVPHLQEVEEVMQYTGLKDIYEGDIIEDEEGDNYLIFWCESSFAFKADLIGIDDDGKRTYGKFDEFYLFDISCPMVVGNIYENKELIK